MGSRLTAASLLLMLFMATTAIPPIYACIYCTNPPISHPYPPKTSHPPYKKPPGIKPPFIVPPIISPPVINPPVVNPPPAYHYPPPSGGFPPPCPGTTPPPAPPATCPIDAFKLGLCLDVLGGLVHIGLGDPVVNICCPVIGGLLEIEAAICLCTAIRIKVLNLNIFIPLALQVLVTCGKNPPRGFICPPL